MNSLGADNRIDSWSRTLAEWNDEHGAAFYLNAAHLAWNRERQNLLRETATEIAGVKVILSVASKEGVKAGLAENTMWVSLWGRIPRGSERLFVEELAYIAEELGKKKVMFGADEFHYVSGIPMTPSGERLIAAVKEIGFEGGEVADYVGDLQSEATNAYITRARELASERALDFTSVADAKSADELEAFLASEFPGRWTREFRFWRSREDTGRAFWMTLSDSGQIVGFARMAIRGRFKPLDQGWTPGALRLPLRLDDPSGFSKDDSCLGPIGVAASQRGRGTGKILLGLVLETLRANDARRVCIDWTNAFKYYEPLEYEHRRRIWTAWATRA